MRQRSRKHPYRSRRLVGMDWTEVFEAAADHKVVVGIDVAKEAMVAAVMDHSERVLQTIRWSHPTQTPSFLAFVSGLEQSSAGVVVAMEPSGVYGDALRWQLLKRGLEVKRVSPKKSCDMAEIYDGVPSRHDGKSAAIVAVLHVRGASDPWPLESPRERELVAALRLMEVYGKQHRQNLNRLEAQAARHWPELSSILDLGSATVLELLATYGDPAAVAVDTEGAGALMRRIGGRFLEAEKLDAVLQSAESTQGVPLIAEEKRTVQAIAVEVRRNQLEEHRMRRRIEKMAAIGEATRPLAPVVGKATAAVLVAGIGDFRGFASPQALVKATGLNLREYSSGKKKGGLHITKRGSGIARFYLWMAVLRLIQSDAVICAWYARKVRRQGGEAKSKAVVAVMRKLLLGLWHVARGESFDSTKLFDIRRLGLVPTS